MGPGASSSAPRWSSRHRSPSRAFDQDNFDEPADGFNYNYVKISQFPDRNIGYRTLDLQATKTFEFFDGAAVQVRIDVLNVTNRKNYADLRDGYPGLPYYFTDGNLWGVPRTLKLGMNVRF